MFGNIFFGVRSSKTNNAMKHIQHSDGYIPGNMGIFKPATLLVYHL